MSNTSTVPTLNAALDADNRRRALKAACRRALAGRKPCDVEARLPDNVSKCRMHELDALCDALGVDKAAAISAYARDVAKGAVAPDTDQDEAPQGETPMEETDATRASLAQAKALARILAPLDPVRGYLDAKMIDALRDNVKGALTGMSDAVREARRERDAAMAAAAAHIVAAPVAPRPPLAEGEALGVVTPDYPAAAAFGFVKGADALMDRLRVDVWNDPTAPAIDPAFVFNPETLGPALAALARCGNVWLHGPRGTGKTQLVEQIAARLGRAFYRVAFDRHTEPAELWGGRGLVAGETVWQDSKLTQALRHPGAIVLLDEPSIARSGTLATLQTALDHRYVTLETGERVDFAPCVTLFAADNTNGTGDASGLYADTNILNAAFLDRFAITLAVDYLPARLEAQALSQRTGAPAALCEALVVFAGKTRAKAGAELSSGVGFRRLIALAQCLVDGFPSRLAFDVALLNSASPEDAQPLAQMILADVSHKDIERLAKGGAPVAAREYRDSRNAKAAAQFDAIEGA